MIVLKLNTPEVAHDVAFTLRGKQFGQYVLVFHHDSAAIELAIELADGKLEQNRRPAFAMAVAAASLVVFQGVIGVWFWTELLTRADLRFNLSESSLSEGNLSDGK
jgi:hypothetical protein